MRSEIQRGLAALLLGAALVLSVAGCDSGNPTATPVSGPTGAVPTLVPTPLVTTGPSMDNTPTSGAPQPTFAPSSREPVIFADYKIEPSSVNPAVAAYTVQPGLKNVENAGDFQLSNAAKSLIEQNAFAAQFPQGRTYKQFYELYQDFNFKQKPAFVTTDALLHVYHLMFDKLLRSIEKKYLIGYLKDLNAAMLKETEAQYASLKGTSAENAARRNLAYFTVASRLLDPNAAIPGDVQNEVMQELALIDAHGGGALSPVMNIGVAQGDFREDYGQYKPRGHYTRSEDLMRYFRAMMWYGRITFRLDKLDETRSALLLTQALGSAKTANGKPAAELWAAIYDPTTFFVGGSDDLSYRDYAPAMKEALGANADAQALTDDAKVEKFRALAQSLAGPRINSMFVYVEQDIQEVTKGLRMMGQRFTLDEYVFGQLMFNKVGTLDKARWLPKGLDVPAALGSTEAYTILDAMGETGYENYSKQMDKVRGEIKGLPKSQWTENLYWSWLYTFNPLLSTKAPDSGFPSFMTNSAWARKDINTVLGSWTELKHDTILYAKQASGVGAGAPPKPPRGYVEPEPEFYARVAALVVMTEDGLAARGLLVTTDASGADNSDYRALEILRTLALNLKHISEKELSNEPLTDDEYETIKSIGGYMQNITTLSSDSEGENQYLDDLNGEDAALVADVATGDDKALTEGTGRFMEIYVVFPIEGKLYLGRGGIYTQYELVQPTGDRLTDEQWRARLNSGNIPSLGDWKTFIAK